MDAGYLQDVLENLDLLDQSLLHYEAVLKDGTAAFSLVHIIFRYTHNAKGGLAVLEQQHLVSVVHVLENAFDRWRNRTLNPSQELLDVALKTVGFVREMLTEGSSSIDPAELIETIERIVGASGGTAVETGEDKLTSTPATEEPKPRPRTFPPLMANTSIRSKS